MDRARIELLHQGRTEEFEYWTDRTHRVFLCRDHKEPHWRAIVDGDVVLDRSGAHLREGLAYPAKALAAKTAEGLAPLLALQENLHCILDEYEAWDPTKPGRLAPLEDAQPA